MLPFDTDQRLVPVRIRLHESELARENLRLACGLPVPEPARHIHRAQALVHNLGGADWEPVVKLPLALAFAAHERHQQRVFAVGAPVDEHAHDAGVVLARPGQEADGAAAEADSSVSWATVVDVVAVICVEAVIVVISKV